MTEEPVWGGAFLLTLPAQWKVTRQEPQIEVSPGHGDGAVHFSVMSRGDNAVVDEQVARHIAELFLLSQKVSSEQFPVATTSADGECRATASLLRDWNGGTWKTELRVVVWPKRAVVGTYVWLGLDDALRDEGLSILSSIRRATTGVDGGKAQTRSRWGRRRVDGR